MKKIEAVLFTDLHIKNTEIENCNNFLNIFCKFVKNNKIKNIFFLGDLYDDRRGLPDSILNYSLFFLNQLDKLNIPIYFLVGNHDKLIKTQENSYLDTFSYLVFQNLNKKSNIDILSKKENSFDYVFFPYFEGPIFEENLNKLKDLTFNKKTILLGHYMYEQIPNEVKKKFFKVFLGHNHERSEFPNGMYLGSCFQQNFSEDENKGFAILYEDGTIEFINSIFKEYILQKIDINTFSKEKIKSYIKNFIIQNPNKYLKIEFIGYNKDISELQEFCKQNNVFFSSKIENLSHSDKEEILNISKFSSNQMKKQFEKFCEENNVENNIKNKILDIMNKQ